VINTIIRGDCLEVMRSLPSDSVNLVFTSPPYEKARTYGIGFKLTGQDWVAWSVRRWLECERLSVGMVSWVVAGQTRDFRWSATPSLLEADLHRLGVNLRDPRVFHRVGIPGSGGPDDWRHDHERIICSSRPGRLPWSDNTVCGHPPKWAPGGEMSHRVSDGARVNQWGHSVDSGATVVEDGGVVRSRGRRPSHVVMTRDRDGTHSQESTVYEPPKLANPGNVIHCNVGGGVMGSKLAQENEAPFPEALAERFIKTYCPPDGVVLDPFCGSGTTLAVAERLGRKWIGIDCRQEMVDLSHRRIAEVRESLTPCQ
jgi:hypothetical protein